MTVFDSSLPYISANPTMMFKVLLVLAFAGGLQAISLSCDRTVTGSGLSTSYQEHIAHAIHLSLNWGIPYFNPRVEAKDVLPYMLKGTFPFRKVSICNSE